MKVPTLAALEAALSGGAPGAWLATIPDAGVRAQVNQALALDRRLVGEHPASLASCLLARLLDRAALAPLCDAWLAEMEACGRPWVRPLRGLPASPGLLAELHDSAEARLTGLARLRFVSNDEVELAAIRFHPSVQPPGERRRERLRWRWRAGEVSVEPDPGADAAPAPTWPRFEHPQWGPSYLQRGPDEGRIALPCPDEGTASASMTEDGRLFVYGSHDEYAGGFVHELDPGSLAIVRHLETSRPVSSVSACERANLLLVSTYDDLLVWRGDRATPLPLPEKSGLLSPDGTVVATLSGGLRIWSLAKLSRGGSPPKPGFSACFDPDGARLLCGTHLRDGLSGKLVASISPHFGHYLEGGPAHPSLHFGTSHLLHLHGHPQAWETLGGAPLQTNRMQQYPHWYALAYDRAGALVAALREGDSKVALHTMPNGQVIREIKLEIGGQTVALSPDGSLLAIQSNAVIEIRSTRDGGFVRHLGGATKKAASKASRLWGLQTPRFSIDGSKVARFTEKDGWRVWRLDGSGEEQAAGQEGIEKIPGFSPPTPPGWTLEEGTRTLFHHHATATTIALPAPGPWVCNPADPRVVACDSLHAVLRAP